MSDSRFIGFGTFDVAPAVDANQARRRIGAHGTLVCVAAATRGDTRANAPTSGGGQWATDLCVRERGQPQWHDFNWWWGNAGRIMGGDDTAENALISKVADLLHVSNGEYIAAKMRAMPQA